MKLQLSEKHEVICVAGDVVVTVEARCTSIVDGEKLILLNQEIATLLARFEDDNPIQAEDEEAIHDRCKPHDSRIGSHHDELCDLYIPF